MRTSSHRFTLLLLSLFATQVATGYAATQTVPTNKNTAPFPANSQDEPHLGEHGPRTLTLKRGETFVVSLPQNADSHGYAWSVINNPEAIRELDDEVVLPHNTTGLVGALADSEWHFVAERQGTHPLVFFYQRPQQAPDADHTVVFDITVTN